MSSDALTGTSCWRKKRAATAAANGKFGVIITETCNYSYKQRADGLKNAARTFFVMALQRMHVFPPALGSCTDVSVVPPPPRLRWQRWQDAYEACAAFQWPLIEYLPISASLIDDIIRDRPLWWRCLANSSVRLAFCVDASPRSLELWSAVNLASVPGRVRAVARRSCHRSKASGSWLN